MALERFGPVHARAGGCSGETALSFKATCWGFVPTRMRGRPQKIAMACRNTQGELKPSLRHERGRCLDSFIRTKTSTPHVWSCMLLQYFEIDLVPGISPAAIPFSAFCPFRGPQNRELGGCAGGAGAEREGEKAHVQSDRRDGCGRVVFLGTEGLFQIGRIVGAPPFPDPRHARLIQATWRVTSAPLPWCDRPVAFQLSMSSPLDKRDVLGDRIPVPEVLEER